MKKKKKGEEREIQTQYRKQENTFCAICEFY
jgi:hypothetical protein